MSFKLSVNVSDFENNLDHKYDVLLIHEDYLKKEIQKLELLKNTNKIKILISVTKKPLPSFIHTQLSLPISLKELNETIENSIAKNNFSKNSSIKIKDYILDKNEKKLKKNDSYILLTEKEIQLIELFLDNKKPIGKEKILKEVWKYAEDADTHTVETHIYRLRKKIKAKFFDVNFILNNKDGYHL